jgi:hypothetical protein
MRCLKLAWAGVAGMGEDLAVLFVPHYARRRNAVFQVGLRSLQAKGAMNVQDQPATNHEAGFLGRRISSSMNLLKPPTIQKNPAFREPWRLKWPERFDFCRLVFGL